MKQSGMGAYLLVGHSTKLNCLVRMLKKATIILFSSIYIQCLYYSKRTTPLHGASAQSMPLHELASNEATLLPHAIPNACTSSRCATAVAAAVVGLTVCSLTLPIPNDAAAQASTSSSIPS